MRGHWISSTRKLNKHYQDGGRSTPPPPSDWVWKKYVVGGPRIPLGWEHDTTYNAYEPGHYYNKPYYDAYYYAGGAYTQDLDLARGYAWEGPVHRISGLPEPGLLDYDTGSDDYKDWYVAQTLQRKKPIWDSNYGIGAFSGSHRLNLHYDMGKRYVKYVMPAYTYAPSYFYGSKPTIQEALGKGDIVRSNIVLSALASKEIADLRTIYMRGIVRWMDDGGNWVRDYLDIQDEQDTGQMYIAEQSGISYIRGDIWIRKDGHDEQYEARIFVFLHNGEYYIDLCAHLYQNGVEVVPPYDVFCDIITYPAVLSGYCYMGPYVQSDHSWPTAYPSAMGDYSLYYYPISGWYGIGAQGQTDGTYECFYTAHTEAVEALPSAQLTDSLKISYMKSQFLNCEDVSEQDFWQAESDWHTIHGGIPYTPLTP